MIKYCEGGGFIPFLNGPICEVLIIYNVDVGVSGVVVVCGSKGGEEVGCLLWRRMEAL